MRWLCWRGWAVGRRGCGGPRRTERLTLDARFVTELGNETGRFGSWLFGSVSGAVRRCGSGAWADRLASATAAAGWRRFVTVGWPTSMTSRGSGVPWLRVGDRRDHDNGRVVVARLDVRLDHASPRRSRSRPAGTSRKILVIRYKRSITVGVLTVELSHEDGRPVILLDCGSRRNVRGGRAVHDRDRRPGARQPG
jgi:hypothetical protein